jgi:osmotically-inducible protein OsmY
MLPSFAVFFAISLFTGPVFAQTPALSNSATWSQEDALRIIQEVQKKLGGLSNYGVFDWITFGIHGKTIVLKGYASRPTVKSEAGNVLKKISGVESVDNQIQVLPLSGMDDRIRIAVYNRIYTQPALRIYNANQGTINQALGPGGRSAARMSGGIVNYPPRGFQAIHIIVKNGNVILYGVVNSETDKSIAGIQANSTSGVFSVDNDLVVENSAKK